MEHNLTLTKYSAGDVSEITGLPPVMQRDWRRKGFLPEIGEGHARFDAFGLCEIWARRLFLDQGIKPSVSGEASKLCSFAIVARALVSPQAYQPADERAASPTHNEAENYRNHILRQMHSKIPERHLPMILKTPRFFVWFSNGDTSWGDGLDDIFTRRLPNIKNGPAVVLDLHRQATDLLREAGELARVSSQERVEA